MESLNEGENIPNLDAVIIEAFNSKPLNLIQRIGRVVRIRDNHKANIYILVSKETQQEEWLNNALSSLDSSNIEIIEL